jgi:hypothetical protein
MDDWCSFMVCLTNAVFTVFGAFSGAAVYLLWTSGSKIKASIMIIFMTSLVLIHLIGAAYYYGRWKID